MKSRAMIFTLMFCLILGCSLTKPKSKQARHSGLRKGSVQEVKNFVAPFQQYIATNFDWPSVRRVVLMPLANQTAYTRIHEQMHANLAAELQRAGRFEIVAATREDETLRALDVFLSGQFNEIELLRIAREYQADAVIFANITQYHPYSPPSVGLSLLMISPAEGVVVASLTGLWDMREKNTAEQAEIEFAQHQEFSRSLRGPERVLESPDVFQRFVSRQIAVALDPPAANGTIPPGTQTVPFEPVVPIDPNFSGGMAPPPVPPATMDMR
ncbi:hypothetical protein [Schlesneria paludicola]|uniref:hypothetical protein n=1 Tax=Schlesneria paludicola TaxID=360056 RepID=UPI000299DCFA|nr:hypothetical protein [Schlesneria paludicola]